MKEKILLRTLCCLFVAIMACGTALAQNRLFTPPQYKGPIAPMAPYAPAAAPFYSNLVVNTCTACNYDTNNGYFILGPNNCFAPGATQWISYPFVAGHTGVVRSVQLAITQDTAICTGTSTKFTVAIYSDACTGTPGTQIGNSAIATAPAAPCLLARASFGTTGPALTAGTTYWVVVTTSTASNQMGTTAVWWEANSAPAPYNLNDGNGWQAFYPASPGGFAVL